ncbi:hypothetical protein GO496_10905 [Acidovorax citrulli]|nr:hypothetical protein [Paracidovorax citrulli]
MPTVFHAARSLDDCSVYTRTHWAESSALPNRTLTASTAAPASQTSANPGAETCAWPHVVVSARSPSVRYAREPDAGAWLADNTASIMPVAPHKAACVIATPVAPSVRSPITRQ